MSDFSPDKWEAIKTLSTRLQAIKNILDFLDSELKTLSFDEELNPIRKQLETDFEQSLEALLKLIDDEDNEIN